LFPKHKRADNIYKLLRVEYGDSEMVFLFPKHKRADNIYKLLRVEYGDSDMVFLFPKHKRSRHRLYTVKNAIQRFWYGVFVSET
jgi:hypothetical protein